MRLSLKNLLLAASLRTFRLHERKRTSRSKMKEPYVTGTKSFARLTHEMAMSNDGMYPTRGEMYINICTSKDGSIVDDVAVGIVDECYPKCFPDFKSATKCFQCHDERYPKAYPRCKLGYDS